ncbi:hypothetical protein GOP47_0009377 [Adiantum capillus-veneris]|uniref:HTH myb-type domain-containing protein n=1 Tax=Adiantum capillus-veneris TaxID=13818 RepID=A0A9D4UWK7_ADICA|nr:hypothetical protein GOP47_0009377 [Adiantum capillus-veneris]
MAEQNNNKKLGMASDLCLGRPPANIADDRLMSRPVFPVCGEGGAVITNCNYGSMQESGRVGGDDEVAGLERYVKALQEELEKLDAFRREVPICVELLEQAIQDSRTKLALAVAVASSRTVASFGSYRGPHFNIKNMSTAAPYVVNFNKQREGGSVQTTAPRDKGADEDQGAGATAVAGQLHMWPGGLPTCGTRHAHAQHHEHNINDQQPHEVLTRPEATACTTQATSNTLLHDHPSRLQLNPLHAFYPNVHNFCHVAASAPRPQLNTPGSLRINPNHAGDMNRPINLQSTEGSSPISHCKGAGAPLTDLLTPSSARVVHDSFDAHGFSSPNNSGDENAVHGLLARQVNTYQEMVVESMQLAEHERCNSIHYNHIVSPNGGQTPRKARRCWSPELHQRFLHALQQLGGPQVATPKQIREVMHVEGLTNDEVKSHLQKFRLHTRRPAPMQVAANEPAQQPHHLVLFGGIWMPSSPADSSPMATCQLATGGHAASSPASNSPFMHFQHVIGQHPSMQALLGATSSEDQQHVGMESASEVDVARSDQSSQNGEAGGVDNNSTMHEDEDTEMHLGSKPAISKEITSSVAKARYQ